MRVSLEPPSRPAEVRVIGVDKECSQHFSSRHDPEELAVIRQLGDVVRGRRRGAAEPVGRLREGRDQARARLAVEGLEDAGLVEHDAGVVARRDLVQPFIVGYLDAGARAKRGHLDSDPLRLRDGLGADAQRGQNQDSARNPRGPRDLHARLAESGIGEERGPAFAERPERERGLEREEPGGKVLALHGEAGARPVAALAGKEGRVVHALSVAHFQAVARVRARHTIRLTREDSAVVGSCQAP